MKYTLAILAITFVSLLRSQSDTLFVKNGELPKSIYRWPTDNKVTQSLSHHYNLSRSKSAFDLYVRPLPNLDDFYRFLKKSSDSSGFNGIVKFSSDYIPDRGNPYFLIESTCNYVNGIRLTSKTRHHWKYRKSKGDSVPFIRSFEIKKFDSIGVEPLEIERFEYNYLSEVNYHSIWTKYKRGSKYIEYGRNPIDTLEFRTTNKDGRVGYGISAELIYNNTWGAKDSIYKRIIRYNGDWKHGICEWPTEVPMEDGETRDNVFVIIKLLANKGVLADVLNDDAVFLDEKNNVIDKTTFLNKKLKILSHSANWFTLLKGNWHCELLPLSLQKDQFQLIFYLGEFRSEVFKNRRLIKKIYRHRNK